VELFAFDKAYVDRLRDGDAATEEHFVSYFGQLLKIKLRARMLAADTVNELRQETFVRVVVALRNEGGIRQPERLGAFVNSICNNVLLEFYRASSRSQPLEDVHLEKTGNILDIEDSLVTKETIQQIRGILEELPERDRRVLRALFLEEKEKDEVCREFGVDRGYLRVLLHRAKEKFRSVYRQETTAVRTPVAAEREGR
jgi:RNA polymerase sigma-70 factor (ECF subfamily)